MTVEFEKGDKFFVLKGEYSRQHGEVIAYKKGNPTMLAWVEGRDTPKGNMRFVRLDDVKKIEHRVRVDGLKENTDLGKGDKVLVLAGRYSGQRGEVVTPVKNSPRVALWLQGRETRLARLLLIDYVVKVDDLALGKLHLGSFG